MRGGSAKDLSGLVAQAGFALPATIWIIAIAALVLVAAAEWAGGRVATARALQERVVQDRALHDREQTLLYTFITHPIAAQGMDLTGRTVGLFGATPPPAQADDPGAGVVSAISDGPSEWLYLDGRPYLQGDGLAAVQDMAGLVNLNFASRGVIEQLLGTLGVPDRDRPDLVSKLQDYVDEDDLIRVGGAERDQYEAAGLPPPANDRLRSVEQVRRVMGWAEQDALWRDDALVRTGSTAIVNAMNVNAMPPTVLQALFYLRQDQVDQLVELREETGVISLEEVGASVPPLVFGAFGMITFPSTSHRLMVWSPSEGRRLETDIELTPLAPAAPFRILSRDIRAFPKDRSLGLPTARLPTLDELGTSSRRQRPAGP